MHNINGCSSEPSGTVKITTVMYASLGEDERGKWFAVPSFYRRDFLERILLSRLP
jgi:hypothetical protein